MKVIHVSEVPREKADAPIFVGDVTRQPLLSDSQDYDLGMVNFEIGARNRWHIHSGDQVLFVTYGVLWALTAFVGVRQVRASVLAAIPRDQRSVEVPVRSASEATPFTHSCRVTSYVPFVVVADWDYSRPGFAAGSTQVFLWFGRPFSLRLLDRPWMT